MLKVPFIWVIMAFFLDFFRSTVSRWPSVNSGTTKGSVIMMILKVTQALDYLWPSFPRLEWDLGLSIDNVLIVFSHIFRSWCNKTYFFNLVLPHLTRIMSLGIRLFGLFIPVNQMMTSDVFLVIKSQEIAARWRHRYSSPKKSLIV